VTKVQPPKKAGKGNGEAPVKLCGSCAEICHAAARVCPCCEYQFPPPKEKELFLHGDCIMGIENSQAFIEKWSFQPHMTVKNIECILVKYFLKGKKTPIPEYLLVYHPGWVGQDANRTLRTIASKTIGLEQLDSCRTIPEVVRALNKAKCPAVIEYKAAGKYPKITERLWHETSNI
jgi:DNA repair protein RadD